MASTANLVVFNLFWRNLFLQKNIIAFSMISLLWDSAACWNPSIRLSYVVSVMAAVASFTKEVNTLRPRRNRRHFADDIFKCIFLNENVLISINISLKFIPNGPINNIPALDQIMAWRRPGDKSLFEPMMIISLTHICVTRPQWVNPRLAKRPLKTNGRLANLVLTSLVKQATGIQICQWRMR